MLYCRLQILSHLNLLPSLLTLPVHQLLLWAGGDPGGGHEILPAGGQTSPGQAGSLSEGLLPLYGDATLAERQTVHRVVDVETLRLVVRPS